MTSILNNTPGGDERRGEKEEGGMEDIGGRREGLEGKHEERSGQRELKKKQKNNTWELRV